MGYRKILRKTTLRFPEWIALAEDVHTYGMRNANVIAIAPNGSTSIIAGSTATIDPVYELVSYEEKTTYKVANPAPDLNENNLVLQISIPN